MERINTQLKLIGFAVVIIVINLSFAACSFVSGTIGLPNTDAVTRIEFGTLSITNQDDIATIMFALSEANRLNRNAMNDQPFGHNH